MNLTPYKMKKLLRFYGPYLGAGIRVTHISDDWREVQVEMIRHWYNRNAVGTHFGGSLYSMVDPHFMLMLMQLLGEEYMVWDKSAHIDFLKAVRGKVTAKFYISDQELEDIRNRTENGEKYLPEFAVEIHDEGGEAIARVKKVIYIRKKKK